MATRTRFKTHGLTAAKARADSTPRLGVRAAAALLLLLGLSGAACSGSSGSSGNVTSSRPPAKTSTSAATTTTTPPPTYPGRLLIVAAPADTTSQPTQVLQLTSASFRPVPMDSFPTFTGQVKAIAPDHSSILYQAPDESLHLTGPDIDVALPKQVEAGALSPDGSQIAYSSTIDRQTSLFVHDIATGTDRVVLEEPCAFYSNAPEDGKICGSITGQIWIDASTLFVVHYAGEMPGAVSCQPGDPVTLCYPIPANTYSLVSTDARLIASMSNDGTNAEVPAAAHGSTVMMSNGTWIDLDELRSSTATIKDVPPGAEVGSLSPDGTKVAVPAAGGWEVTDLRSGASTQLGTPGIAPEATDWNSDTVVWSPDGKFFAVQSSVTDITVVPVSAERGGPAGSLGEQDMLFAWDD